MFSARMYAAAVLVALLAVVDTSATTATSSPYASRSDVWFHVRARDAAGNWSATAVHRGPFFIDVSPSSSSASSPSTSSGSPFTVTWSGSDAHSGIASYDVQYRDVSTNSSWTSLTSNTTATSATFYGWNGHIYQFRSRARDKAGNLELYPGGYDSQTGVNNIDVRVRYPGLEVNQAVQDLNNSVVLIAGKRTFVRAYVQSDSGVIPAVPARLRVYRGNLLKGTLSPSNPGATISVTAAPGRSSLNQAYYFDVPTAWLNAGAVTFQFEINTPQKYAEND